MKNVKVENLAPKIQDRELARLMPTVLQPYRFTFELHGVNVAIANAIRRVILSELPAVRLMFDAKNFKTTDPFQLVDYIRDTRIGMIPIRQDIDPKTVYRLAVVNDSETPMMVKSGMLECIRGDKRAAFNETFDICRLAAKSSIVIDDITVVRGYGYQNSGFSVAFNAMSIPLDVQMFDEEKSSGVSSSVSDPRNFRLGFTCNGVMDPKDIVKVAVNEIIARLERISKSIQDVQSAGDLYTLTVSDETDTTGNIIIKFIADERPDVTATYSVSPLAKSLTLKIRTSDDIATVLSQACKSGIKMLRTFV